MLGHAFSSMLNDTSGRIHLTTELPSATLFLDFDKPKVYAVDETRMLLKIGPIKAMIEDLFDGKEGIRYRNSSVAVRIDAMSEDDDFTPPPDEAGHLLDPNREWNGKRATKNLTTCAGFDPARMSRDHVDRELTSAYHNPHWNSSHPVVHRIDSHIEWPFKPSDYSYEDWTTPAVWIGWQSAAAELQQMAGFRVRIKHTLRATSPFAYLTGKRVMSEATIRLRLARDPPSGEKSQTNEVLMTAWADDTVAYHGQCPKGNDMKIDYTALRYYAKLSSRLRWTPWTP